MIQIFIILKQKMGNKIDQRTSQTCKMVFKSNNSSNDMNMSQCNTVKIDQSCSYLFQSNIIELSRFKSSLNQSECFYLFFTLIQQFYYLYKKFKKVIISIKLCYVNHFGLVKVLYSQSQIQKLQAYEKKYSHSFVDCISLILEEVIEMAAEKDIFDSSSSAYFNDKMIKIIYRNHHNDEQLYDELIQEIGSFLSTYGIKGNLISAVIRLKKRQQIQNNRYSTWKKSQTQTSKIRKISLLQKMSTFNHMQEKSFSKNDDSTKINSFKQGQQNFRGTSFFVEQKQKNNLSKYRHKKTKTEGQHLLNQQKYTSRFDDQNNTDQMKQKVSYFSKTSQNFTGAMQIKQKPNKKYISPQYSLNIYTNNIQQNLKKSQLQQKRKVLFENQIKIVRERSSQETHKLKHVRQNTAVDLNRNSKQYNPAKLSYAKSILQILARQVTVRDQPSSRSMIN